MKTLLSFVNQLNWVVVIILCATLGLAPFVPPHIFEKLAMLMQGNLVKPLDWFDLLLHGLPWVVLILKMVAFLMKKSLRIEA